MGSPRFSDLSQITESFGSRESKVRQNAEELKRLKYFGEQSDFEIVPSNQKYYIDKDIFAAPITQHVPTVAEMEGKLSYKKVF